MVDAQPLAIFLGAIGTVGLALFGFWEVLHGSAEGAFGKYANVFERANIQRRPEEHVAIWLGTTAILWLLAVLIVRPAPLLGLLALPLVALLAAVLYLGHARYRLFLRTEQFIEQLELALRIMGSGLRSGLGTRQSLAIVIDEMPDPARHEFSRVIGQANIGTSMFDALDDLAARIQRAETSMMARVMRIQSHAGGDLARVLEQLANTIRDRRRMRRKVSSLTAEGRASAIVLVLLPLCIGSFIALTQHQLGHALFTTRVGHITMMIVGVLEAGGILALKAVMRVKFG